MATADRRACFFKLGWLAAPRGSPSEMRFECDRCRIIVISQVCIAHHMLPQQLTPYFAMIPVESQIARAM